MTSISNQLYLNQQQKKPVVKAAPLKSKRLAAPSTSYPWVPLYRRRRGVVVSKRCQPVVASSPTTASALFTSFGQIVPTA